MASRNTVFKAKKGIEQSKVKKQQMRVGDRTDGQ